MASSYFLQDKYNILLTYQNIMNNHKLTKKLQVLLTEDEVAAVNRVILNDAMDTESRPISVSAWIRDLIKKELSVKSIEQQSFIKNKVKNLNNK